MRAPTQTPVDDVLLFRKVTLRILPILLLSYVIAYIDRVSIGFAKLQMLSDLHFSESVYGLGAGIFFLGFILFEIPSNLLLYRVGARRWIARIMVTWGVISILIMGVASPAGFYALRFSLGVAEAGFFPGVIYYLTRWFPQDRRARTFSLFTMGAAVGGIVVGPLSGWMMGQFENVGGLHNWQWLFLLQGLPAVAIGIALLALLAERPDTAPWLSAPERARIAVLLAADEHVVSKAGSVSRALSQPRTWLLGFVMAAVNLGIYAGVFWTPSILKVSGIGGYAAIGVLSALPYALSMLVMFGLGRSSDLLGERRWHIALSCLAAATGLALSGAFVKSPVLSVAGLMFSTAMFIGLTPLLWALASQFFTGKAAAVGFALLNVFGALGGFFGPYLMGLSQAHSGSTALAAYVVCGCACMAAVMIVALTGTTRASSRN